MAVLKKYVSYVLIIVCLLSVNAVYADTSFTESATEVDQSTEVYSFIDDFSRESELVDTTKTGVGSVLDSNWSSKATGTMDGDGTGVTTFGFDGQDLAVGYYKQDTYPKTSGSQAAKMAGFNWKAPHGGLSSNFVIKTTARKTHNVNMWGVRFMQHNDEQNYYMLFLGGQYSYQLTSGVISWGLYKVKNGAVTILHEQMQTEDESRKFIGTAADAKLTLTYNNGKISFNVAYNGDESYYSGTYTDTDEPYVLAGDDMSVQLVASSAGNSAYPIYFRDFSIVGYIPYITGGEPENVIYNDITRYAKYSDACIADFYRAYPVRKIQSTGLANAVKDIYLSADGTSWDKVSDAQFDSQGIWLNNKSQKAYRYLYYENLDKNDLNVYTDISENYVYDAVVTDVIELIASDLSVYEWAVNNDTMAQINNGVLTLLRRKGDVEVTAVKNDLSFKAVFNIIGEMEMAQRNNTVSQYLWEKKAVIDAVNAAINANSYDDFKAIMRDEGTIKIGSIVDLDTTKVSNLSDDKLLTLFNRISTYDDFKCEEPENLYEFSKVLDTEYAVGELCGIATVADFETAFNTNNEYIGLATDNFYFENYNLNVFAKLLNIQFENYADFISKYNEAMISVSYEKALSYVMVQNFVDFFPEIIGYDVIHYDEVKGDDLYKEILDKKGELNTIAELKQYIDNYTKPTVTKPSTSRPSGSGGGGGGSSISSSYQVAGKENQVVLPLETMPAVVIAFDDVDSNHWAYNSIVALKNKNIINGYNDGCFYPDNNVTRAEFVKILIGALGLELTEEKSSFSDVSTNDWFAPYVTAAEAAGIIKGDGVNFNGNSNITRQEMAVMIYRSFKEIETEEIANADFDDMDEVAEWAKESVNFLNNKGIITGYNNLFKPLDNATRAEVSQIVYKVIQGA